MGKVEVFLFQIQNIKKIFFDEPKLYSQAYFRNYSKEFFYFSYNDTTDFSCGYSNEVSDYYNIENVEVINYADSPLQFTDDVEIQEMNFILYNKYVQYKIYNKDKNIYYHGIIDVTLNKIVFNTAETIDHFIPYSESEMLAITPNTAYKICIIKSGSSCIDKCDTEKSMILDTEGNKCQEGTECGSGKIKFIPGEICIKTEQCNLNIYKNNNTHCGLCKYFDQNGAKYKLVGSESNNCLSEIPDGAEEYNEDLHLLRCKSGYILSGDICETHCYEFCATCSDYSTDVTQQKCLHVKKVIFRKKKILLIAKK